MYGFFVPLVLGFTVSGVSAFTAAFSRRFGEHGGQMATMILRNLVGIPLWAAGYILAWQASTPWLFASGPAVRITGWLLIVTGSIPVILGHLQLGWRTHMPSVRDTLVRTGLYGRVRHPIYAGGLLIFPGLVLIRPTSAVAAASALGLLWVILQARLEELDLVQRLPAYRQYMREVPRFVPRASRR
ncbi:MAG: methyltransferase [Armatimonadota bacterium]|nr:methyltransferase [Armatimonadota bacterium]MDR7466776.1 methyltransferase [Armatimonadota bacterium]MDR7492751.1 methyltransferase [Armatimonadota bacterium]MDR7498527.1 methyltransferase [Armatimonadota bacterium]MDR7504306.1 methyltransferase [Armatimonadota bacterium]